MYLLYEYIHIIINSLNKISGDNDIGQFKINLLKKVLGYIYIIIISIIILKIISKNKSPIRNFNGNIYNLNL